MTSRLTLDVSSESADFYQCGIGIRTASNIVVRAGTMLLDKGEHTQAVLAELRRQGWAINLPAYLNTQKPLQHNPAPKPTKKKFIVKPVRKR